MKLSAYDYQLPERLIANEPVSPRDACRLMVVRKEKQTIDHDIFFHIGSYLKKGDVLVLNRSRVIPARLLFQYRKRECEIFLTRKVEAQEWLCLVRPGRMFESGDEFELKDGVKGKVLEVRSDGLRLIRFSPTDDEFMQLIQSFGRVPLPPYIGKTDATFDDYQTVFSAEEGSVAAPTAGLHFTKKLLGELIAKGVQIEYVMLHVGLGTFQPIKVQDTRSHKMHSEYFELETAVARRLTIAKEQGRRIIAVGTTSVRVLESSFDSKKGFIAGKRDTAIFIQEGYKWKCVDGLITNFHLPKSTLLVLVSAFAGRSLVMRAYEEAVRKRYRFYSFGDAMLLL